MNINEGLKEVAALKGKLNEVHAKLQRQQFIKEYVFQDAITAPPSVKQPVPIDALLDDYLKIVADIENLKLRITTANLKSGALTLIHKVSYLKSALSLLKPLTEVEEESLDISSSYMAKTSTMTKTRVNYNIEAVKQLVEKTDLELRETLVALDRLNYSTEI